MKLFERIKKKFKLSTTSVLLNFADLINIPDRYYYKDNKSIIEQIAKYKNEYLSIIYKKETIHSINLNDNNLKNNIEMNTDLNIKYHFR